MIRLTRNLRVGLPLGLCCLGIIFLVWGQLTPVSVDLVRLEQAFVSWCDDGGVNYEAGERYFALMSNRFELLNVGSGLLTLGLVGTWIGLVSRGSTYPLAKSPASRSAFFLIGLMSIFVIAVAELSSLTTDLDRRLFPTCADSIGIPFFAMLSFFAIVSAASVGLGGLISLAFGQLPTSLWVWDRKRHLVSFLISLVFGCAALASAGLGVAGLTSSAAWSAPAWAVVTYLLLSTRAALLSPHDGATDR